MGKIVKFCSACDEGFAEKFGFCPNCGATLNAFEMNPVGGKPGNGSADAVRKEEPAVVLPVTKDFSGEIEETAVAETSGEDFFELNAEDENETAETVVSSEPETKMPASIFSSNGSYQEKDYQEFSNADVIDEEIEGDYHITVIEEKNVQQRNVLLLGSTTLILSLAIGGFLFSLFGKALDVAAIDQDTLGVYVNDLEPEIAELEKPENKKDDEGGGGGGGGNKSPDPASRGRTAPMMEDPQMAPSVTMNQLKNPVIPVQMGLKGPQMKNDEDKTLPYGLKNSPFEKLSDGTGTNGGQGSGNNRGQGPGDGPGLGPGSNGGAGGGNNGGLGPGSGPGTGTRNNNPPEPREPAPAGPSKGLQITYKPKPRYTDSARQANITGNVTVRVTFLASGQIGSVSTVSGLGYGLTEQALAAAKQIRFEPQLKNGRPVTVVKSVVFNFTIY